MDHEISLTGLPSHFTPSAPAPNDVSPQTSTFTPNLTTQKLSIDCFGYVELPEDDPYLGTYWTRRGVSLGVDDNLIKAMELAERHMRRLHVSLLNIPLAKTFSPEIILIRDSLRRLALGGKVVRNSIVWCEPVTSDDEASRVRREAANLRVEAVFESGWDNYSTARSLDRRAELLEASLIDPIWRVEAAAAFQLRNSLEAS